MSHITNAKTKLKLPVDQPEQLEICKGWLAKAVSTAAKVIGGEVTNYYYSYRKAQKFDCDLAIITPTMERGMSIQVHPVTGALYFKGDSYAVEAEVAQMQRLVIQAYQASVVEQVLAEMGYTSVDIFDGEQAGQLVVKGVAAYA